MRQVGHLPGIYEDARSEKHKTRDGVFEMWRLRILGFCLWGWKKSEVNKKREVDKGGELLARI